jgi:nucleoside phosphorylase
VAPPSIDVGILTVREDEFRALLAVFPNDEGVYRGQREYSIRIADAGGGACYRVALLRAIEQGNGESQDAARDFIEDLRPSLLLVVGIAGALPSQDFTLGDVVLSTRVNEYCVSAQNVGAEPTYNLGGGPIEKQIAAGVSNLPARARDLGEWTRELPKRPAVAWDRRGALYGPDAWRRELKRTLEHHFSAGQPRAPLFTAGVIASSDVLVKDPKVVCPWTLTARHLLAVEMESAGVFRAARGRCPMLAIRGISDVIGLRRDNSWTKFACASAAAFARAYLRTQPISPLALAASGPAARDGAPRYVPLPGGTPSPLPEPLYSNLLPLRAFPLVVHVAPTTGGSIGEARARLLEGQQGQLAAIPQAWALHEKMLYSFTDPAASRLSRLADVGGVECHETSYWAFSDDPNKRRLFVWLLNGALRDDLETVGVSYFHRDNVFAFAGKPDEPDRKHAYRSLHRDSEIRVVFHREKVRQDGRRFTHLRHNAFRGRFRLIDGTWHLEVTPTYRFTSDGVRKYRFHEDQLRGIKKLERNRAVLSQILLWTDVLCPPLSLFPGPSRLLRFGPGLVLQATKSVPDEQWAVPGDEGIDDAQAVTLPLLDGMEQDPSET